MYPHEIRLLINEQDEAQTRANSLQGRISYEQEKCDHDWAPVKYIPEYQENDTIPDRSHGSDFSPACDVPEKTTRKWSRHCYKCLLEQTTKRTKNVKYERSIMGAGATEEVPDFPTSI